MMQGSGKGDASSFLLLAVSTTKGGGGTLWRVRVTGSTAGGWTVSKPRSEELAGAAGAHVVSCAAHPKSSILSVVWSDGAWSRLRVTGANTANKSVLVADSEVAMRLKYEPSSEPLHIAVKELPPLTRNLLTFHP